MGERGRRAFRFGANVAKSVCQGWRDCVQRDGLPSLDVGNLRSSFSPVRIFPAQLSNVRRRNSQHGRKGNLVSFACVDLSFSCRRGGGFIGTSCGLWFSVERPHCSSRSTCRWFMEGTKIFKAKPAVFGRGGQVAAVSLWLRSSSTSVSLGLTGCNRILEVVRFYGSCYRQLSKVHLSFFVVSTASVGYVMGSGEVVDCMGLAWTSMGTMLAASSANAFNQILEVANDGRMKRTMRRPLPSGRISKAHALAFAVTAGITGVSLLAWKTSALAAELGAANILLYSLVYTPLKQIHCINTWVGAVVGAIPPLLGWAAASSQLDAGAWVLASALYFWQIPHFMALAFMFRGDYAAGGYKMLSLLDFSGKRTAFCALRNCLYLLSVGFLAQNWGTTSGYFGVENLMLTIGIGTSASLFYHRPSKASARKLFRTSLLYLPILMTAMVVHRIPNPNSSSQQLAAIDADKFQEFHSYRRGFLSAPTSIDFEQRTSKHRRSSDLPPPPISVLSAAPFPFLPAPDCS